MKKTVTVELSATKTMEAEIDLPFFAKSSYGTSHALLLNPNGSIKRIVVSENYFNTEDTATLSEYDIDRYREAHHGRKGVFITANDFKIILSDTLKNIRQNICNSILTPETVSHD